MIRYWQEISPALYGETRREVETKYPTLRFEIRRGIVFVVGSFPICNDKGVIESFPVEIELPPRFPRDLPVVRETGHQFPRTADYHMFPNGTCCLFVEEDWWLAHPHGYRLIQFLDGPVRNFFLGQSMVKVGLPLPFGERAHGIKGILECYAGLTGASNLAIAEEYLKLLTQKKIRGHHLCPCGSGKKLRHCHQRKLLELRERIPRYFSRNSWQRVLEFRAWSLSR